MFSHNNALLWSASRFPNEEIGIAKDKLGLRPGVMAENDEVFAIASEEMALQDVMETDHVEQIAPGEVRAYTM